MTDLEQMRQRGPGSTDRGGGFFETWERGTARGDCYRRPLSEARVRAILTAGA
jgi:hypothetical protein